jgi:hypothetical protein
LTVTTDISKQLLPRPPRLLPSGSGYDWREFDRWMQRVYSLIGTPQNSATYNIPASLGQNSDEQADLDFVTDNSLEIQLLRQMVEQLSTEVNMFTDQQQNFLNLSRKVDDLYSELGVS